jgi:hypothetical protein
MTDYSKVLYDLRHNLHKDIVQTASLNDIFFDGDYIFEEPVKAVVGHYLFLGEFEPKIISIKGINDSSDMIAEDKDGNRIYVRYMDVPLESLNEMLVKLKSKKFLKGKKTVELVRQKIS